MIEIVWRTGVQDMSNEPPTITTEGLPALPGETREQYSERLVLHFARLLAGEKVS